MAQIKPMPTHIREYYKAMRDAYTQRKEEAFNEKEELIKDIINLQQEVVNNHEVYESYGIDLGAYPEFINNEYETGKFLKLAEGAYLNRGNDYELTADLYHLLDLARKQYKISELNKSIEFYNKILSIKVNDYIKYIREYFNIVHKKMILEGYAYHFGENIGDVIINRVKVINKRPAINYKATKEKKKEILERGGRLYSKAQDNFCKANGIEYKYEDHRVFMENEYFYEVFMANKRFKEAHSFEFTPQDYRSVEIRGKSNKELIKMCDEDLNKICELPIDMKSKINMCVEVDKTLYTNFIRNENQTSYKYKQTCG